MGALETHSDGATDASWTSAFKGYIQEYFWILHFSPNFLLSVKSSVGGAKITYFKVDVEQNDLRMNYSYEQHLSSLTSGSHLL